MEVINSIQDEFDKIIVITHLEELKEAFPSRIDVSKTPQGSIISVNEAAPGRHFRACPLPHAP